MCKLIFVSDYFLIVCWWSRHGGPWTKMSWEALV